MPGYLGSTDRRPTNRTLPYVEEDGGSIQPVGSGILAAVTDFFACFGTSSNPCSVAI
jgi:hypothetical protein